jgi:hypothetical protein
LKLHPAVCDGLHNSEIGYSVTDGNSNWILKQQDVGGADALAGRDPGHSFEINMR